MGSASDRSVNDDREFIDGVRDPYGLKVVSDGCPASFGPAGFSGFPSCWESFSGLGAFKGLGVSPPASVGSDGRGGGMPIPESDVAACKDWDELCALALALPGIRFFLSRLGCRGSFSLPEGGDLLKRLDNFRSFVGVTAARGGEEGTARVS